eukprot:1631186-Pleurochrysis_carterae.AAC.1
MGTGQETKGTETLSVKNKERGRGPSSSEKREQKVRNSEKRITHNNRCSTSGQRHDNKTRGSITAALEDPHDRG